MKVVNISSKVVTIGSVAVMPDDFVEVSQATPAILALKRVGTVNIIDDTPIVLTVSDDPANDKETEDAVVEAPKSKKGKKSASEKTNTENTETPAVTG